MCCELTSIRTLAAITAFTLICSSFASAQTNDNANATGGQQDGGEIDGALSAEEAFTGVERGDTIGATTETGAGFSNLGAGADGQAGGLGGFGGGFGGGGFGGGFGGQNFGGQSQNSTPLIRTRLRSAIEGTYPTPQAIGKKLNYQMQTVPRRAGLNGVNVSVNGTTAIVTGVVSTDKQRRMTELLMRLEPGVRHVDNRITVAP